MQTVYLWRPVYSNMNGFVFCHQNDHRRRKKTRLSIKTEKADKEKTEIFFNARQQVLNYVAFLMHLTLGMNFISMKLLPLPIT